MKNLCERLLVICLLYKTPLFPGSWKEGRFLLSLCGNIERYVPEKNYRRVMWPLLISPKIKVRSSFGGGDIAAGCPIRTACRIYFVGHRFQSNILINFSLCSEYDSLFNNRRVKLITSLSSLKS